MERRRAAELSQSDLARLVGVDGQTISRYERDVLVPGADKLGRIADAVGCTTDLLIHGADKRAESA